MVCANAAEARRPPSSGPLHGLEDDFHALQPVAALVEDAAVDGAGGGEADVDAGRHAAGADVDRCAERRVARAVPAPSRSPWRAPHRVGAGLDRPGLEPAVVVRSCRSAESIGPGDFVAGVGDRTARTARRQSGRGRRRFPRESFWPAAGAWFCAAASGDAAVPVSVAPPITTPRRTSGTAAASQPEGRGADDDGESRRRTRCSSGPSVAASASVVAAAKRFEIGERRRVDDPIAAERHRDVVAAVFPLRADAPRDPPARRVVEEQHLGGGLQQVDGEVVAPDVRELVGDDRIELQRGRGRSTR